MKPHDTTSLPPPNASIVRNPPKSRMAGRRGVKLIIGLGNPGTEYKHTRHNYGAIAAEELAHLLEMPAFRSEKALHASVATARVRGEKILLAKPQTFMNDSGSAVQKLTHYYKVPTADLWIIHDDLDLPPGTVRHSFDSRAGGHNGVQSIIDTLGTKAFHRIRIGIGAARDANIPAERYVLERPTAEEERAVRAAIMDFLPDCIQKGFIEDT